MMSVGATGVISVVSNILPARVKALGDAFLEEKDPEKALDLHVGLMPFFHGLFIETNPGPVKEALYHMGMIEKGIRPPLCGLTEQNSGLSQGIAERVRAISEGIRRACIAKGGRLMIKLDHYGRLRPDGERRP